MLYSSIVMIIMSIIALFLFILFRCKLNSINRLGSQVSPEVYSKSFVVFDPYSKVSVFHRFLLLAVLVVWYGCFLLLYVFFKVLEYGLLFPLILVIACLNVMPLEVAFEVYMDSRDFIQALRSGVKFGVGDVEIFNKLRGTLGRLSNYCLGLSIIFLGSSLFFFASPFWLDINFNSIFVVLPDFLASWGLFGIFFLTFLFVLLFVFTFYVASRVKRFLLGL